MKGIDILFNIIGGLLIINGGECQWLTPGVLPGMPQEGKPSPGLQPPPRTPSFPQSPFKSFNFTNSSSFGSVSQGNTFSSKDFQSKIASIDANGKQMQRNITMKEFAEGQEADGGFISSGHGLNAFKNATTDFEQKLKTQDGGYAQQAAKNTGSEASDSETAEGGKQHGGAGGGGGKGGQHEEKENKKKGKGKKDSSEEISEMDKE